MPLTRAIAERSVISGFGPSLLTSVGMAATYEGDASPNPDLDDPLMRTFDFFRFSATDPSSVTDSDLAQVPPSEQMRFLLYLRIMAAEAIRNRLIAKPRFQKWVDYQIDYGEMAKNMALIIGQLWDEYRRCLPQITEPAVGKLDSESTNQLETRCYFGRIPGF